MAVVHWWFVGIGVNEFFACNLEYYLHGHANVREPNNQWETKYNTICDGSRFIKVCDNRYIVP